MRSEDIDLIPVIKLFNWSFIFSIALLRLLLLLLADSELSDIPDSETLDGANDDAERPKDSEADILFLNLFDVPFLFLSLAGLLVSSILVSELLSSAVAPFPFLGSI